MTSRIDDPDFFRRYIENQIEMGNASYNDGDILFAIKNKETKEFPEDWDKNATLPTG